MKSGTYEYGFTEESGSAIWDQECDQKHQENTPEISNDEGAHRLGGHPREGGPHVARSPTGRWKMRSRRMGKTLCVALPWVALPNVKPIFFPWGVIIVRVGTKPRTSTAEAAAVMCMSNSTMLVDKNSSDVDGVVAPGAESCNGGTTAAEKDPCDRHR